MFDELDALHKNSHLGHDLHFFLFFSFFVSVNLFLALLTIEIKEKEKKNAFPTFSMKEGNGKTYLLVISRKNIKNILLQIQRNGVTNCSCLDDKSLETKCASSNEMKRA